METGNQIILLPDNMGPGGRLVDKHGRRLLTAGVESQVPTLPCCLPETACMGCEDVVPAVYVETVFPTYCFWEGDGDTVEMFWYGNDYRFAVPLLTSSAESYCSWRMQRDVGVPLLRVIYTADGHAPSEATFSTVTIRVSGITYAGPLHRLTEVFVNCHSDGLGAYQVWFSWTGPSVELSPEWCVGDVERTVSWYPDGLYPCVYDMLYYIIGGQVKVTWPFDEHWSAP